MYSYSSRAHSQSQLIKYYPLIKVVFGVSAKMHWLPVGHGTNARGDFVHISQMPLASEGAVLDALERDRIPHRCVILFYK